MCEANAYLLEKDQETLLMEAVDRVEPDEDGIRLISIFGEQKFIKGHIHALSLVDHKVYIKQ
ncbi:MAG: CooT family nickel-binding protein [Desulfobacula sp.]|jgi:predicted RNA-binding protein|nr:CooT family nickel-binding protein [Desulfobacula sp.]MDA8135453.1 CooT family nickel-binding protein [Desulfobacteraceae bacterium]OGR36887.1 MAG: RNA-binding protein [Desulfobacula sp. RIFOXYB2_FULL_45_6]